MSGAAKGAAPGRRVNTFDVFVGNLPPDADQKKVGKVFSKFGEVHGIWIGNSVDGSKYAVVRFYCEEDSIKAIEDTNGMIFEGGKPISCKKAMKRPEKKKDGEQEISDKGEAASKESTQTAGSQVKQRNPDIVPSFESSPSPNFPNTGQGKKDKEKVLISHVETPIVIWGQRLLIDNANDLHNISEQLALICPESPTINGKPDQEKIYGAKFSEDEQWYRCTVRYIFGPDRVKVQYIDFGNTEEINPSSLVELPKSLTALPTCAMKYMLHSCWCNSNQDLAGINFLKEMVEGKEVEIYSTARLTDHTGFYALVYADGVNVGDKMIEAGHAFKKPGLEARGVRARMNMGGGGDGPPGVLNQKINMIAPGGKDGLRKGDSGMGDKDDLSNLKWKLKSLQMENSIMANKIQENNLSVQLRDIKSLVCKVRKLRNQFPLDTETPLDLAIELVQSPGKISMGMAESLPGLMKTIELYKQTQDSILKSDESSLEELVNSRNSARKVLHQELTVTIEELKNVPLEDRGKKVQDVVAALMKHYDYFTRMGALNPNPLDKLAPAFQEWKVKKQSDVREARRMCDTLESTVNSVVNQLKLDLSLNPDQEENDSHEDLTACLKNYTSALQQEIAVSDTENGPDSILIGSLVQALLREMKEESNCVDHLGSVVEEFTNLLESISPWLESTPSLDKLQEVRSKLKGLKSKLRHKLADKVDAEENQEMEELETVAHDLEIIRGKLHDILVEEDTIMAEMSQLANAHFPELIQFNPDLGFKLNLSYKGLVKVSYAPEHFTMTPVGDSSSGIYTSQFAGEEVFIKEYFLNIGKHLGKDDFLHQLAVYSSASSPFLGSIKAVFFDKSNRQAYVLVKKQGELLSEVINQSALPKEKCKNVIGSVSQALDALNRLNIVHGQVRPEFVTMNEDGKAQLLPPDFSLSTFERCNYRFLPNRGIEMIAPELRHQMFQGDPSHYTDVYYLGLLSLWMHHPNGNFLLRKDGAVDFGHLSLDRDFGIFLTKLLSPNPHFRPPADATLHLEYLNQNGNSMMSRSGQPIHGDVSADMDNAMNFSRNSPSPVVLPQSKSPDGRVFANHGDNIQMIADLRVPPPPFNGESPNGMVQSQNMGNYHNHQHQHKQQMSNQHHQYPGNTLPQQQQQQQLQQQQQQQLQQQQLQQQPLVQHLSQSAQMMPTHQREQQQQQQQQHHQHQQQRLEGQNSKNSAVSQDEDWSSEPSNNWQSEPSNDWSSEPAKDWAEATMNTMNTPSSSQNVGDSFEIGTFDPSAFEVVTSPQNQDESTTRSSPSNDYSGTDDWADCAE